MLTQTTLCPTSLASMTLKLVSQESKDITTNQQRHNTSILDPHCNRLHELLDLLPVTRLCLAHPLYPIHNKIVT